MGCCDRNIHIETCDHLVSWDDIIGDPSKNPQLGRYLDDKISEATGGIGGNIQEKLDELREDLEKEIKKLSDKFDDIDAFSVSYHDTTVGDFLDKLKGADPLIGTISEFPEYEKGRRLDNLALVWSFSKPLKTLQIVCDPAYDNDDVLDLDPADKSFVFNGITGNQKFTVVGRTDDGEEVRLEANVIFKLKYYWGSHTEKKPCNEAILNLNNRLVNFKDNHISNIIDCSGGEGEYMFYIFPNDLHLDYSFFTNGMKDSNWDMEIVTVSNAYAYQATYRVYRSGNRQTGSEIFTEVYAHDCY